MGWLVMASVGALLGGLFLCFQNLFPYLAASNSGVIVRKGARGLKVRREEDPDGFARLLSNRGKSAMLGLALSFAGVCVLATFGLAIAGFGTPLALLYFVVSLGFGAFALICLMRGFSTGDMYAFWGFAMQGGANRKQSPQWFWIYALANIFVLLNGGLAVLGFVARLAAGR
ncbi:MAG TPA: hypothetical protein VGL66_00755 [Caulobacteraceae bacterium]|jgi:hypothetical protein